MTATNVQQTSISAYAGLTDISERQSKVYGAISTLGFACNQMIANYLGVPVNQVTGRVFELRDKGLVTAAYKAVWKPTGKTVIWWTTV